MNHGQLNLIQRGCDGFMELDAYALLGELARLEYGNQLR